MNCYRKQCQAELDKGYYKIWNEPSKDIPNLYCLRCGKKIIQYNRETTRQDDVKLKYDIITK